MVSLILPCIRLPLSETLSPMWRWIFCSSSVVLRSWKRHELQFVPNHQVLRDKSSDKPNALVIVTHLKV